MQSFYKVSLRRESSRQLSCYLERRAYHTSGSDRMS